MTDRAVWLRALGLVGGRRGEVGPVPCPDCGQDRLEVRYLVTPEDRLGYVLLWCGACLRGISVSRVRAPEGAPSRSVDDPASLEDVPDFERHE